MYRGVRQERSAHGGWEVECFRRLFLSRNEYEILIAIYSDSRLDEMGGEEAVLAVRDAAYQSEFS
jgi:hypothetical protein